MALVSYSGSESSDSENDKEATKAKPAPKANFKKMIQRSDEGRIKIELPSKPSQNSTSNGVDDGEPAPKKPRLGGGGFNSFLPAPKKANSTPSNAQAKGSIRSGVSLKTSAAPGFSREPPIQEQAASEDIDGPEPPISFPTTDGLGETPIAIENAAPKPVGKITMFKPLSVGANKKKKKASTSKKQNDTPAPLQGSIEPKEHSGFKPATATPLFSFGADVSNKSIEDEPSTGSYVPMFGTLEDSHDGLDSEGDHTSSSALGPADMAAGAGSRTATNGSQTLEDIASDMNLSELARRQLFGRKSAKGGQSGIPANILNFNMDREYAANEELRQAGETVQHNPVRAIAPGKHSLQQLVNAASSQKDALEESFAKGRNNKKEAGSRYGW